MSAVFGFPEIAGSDIGSAYRFLIVYITVMLIMSGYNFVSYIFQCLGMYTIAKRRGTHRPWLAWIPVGVNWILGSISDQYQYVAKGQVKNRRKVLLGMSIALLAIAMVLMVLSVMLIVNSVMALNDASSVDITIGFSLIVLLLSLVAMVLVTITVVYQYISLYDLFASCNPKYAVVFLVLCIFFPIAAFLIFAVRNKDLGMPPRKPQPQAAAYQIPVMQSEQVSAEEQTTAETEE